MSLFRVAVAAVLAQQAATEDILQVGGIIQNTGVGGRGKATFDFLQSYINGASKGYKLNITWFWQGGSDAGLNYTEEVPRMMAAASPPLNALIAPYGSGSAGKFISAVPANSPLPIMVWGGASDSLFSTNCQNRKCFGTLTKASQYTTPSLDAVFAKQPNFSISTITNSNGFSKSVSDGTVSWVNTKNTVRHLKHKELTVAKKALTAADLAAVDEVIADKPDVVAISGHAGDVEEVIMRIRTAAGYKPKAVIATNAFTDLDKYRSAGKLNQLVGVVMPDQWAELDTTKDAVTGWTTPVFKKALTDLGVVPSYHAASAAAAGIAMVSAMEAGKVVNAGGPSAIVTNFASNMPNVNTASLYGNIAFAADGSITKPMYGRQRTDCTATKVVPPSANLVFPMPDAPAGADAQCPESSATPTTQPTTPTPNSTVNANTTQAPSTTGDDAQGVAGAQETTASVLLMLVAAVLMWCA